MAYTKQTWQDLPSKTTPINASRLGHIEQGIFDAAATADTAASNASSAISGLADKVDKVEGKGLSTNDFTDALKTKLNNIEAGAEVNVQADYAQNDTTADDYIKNKPTLGTSAYKNSTSVVTDSTDLVESGAVYDAIQDDLKNTDAVVESTVGWVGKNLLNSVAVSKATGDGFVFTVNADKSVTMNGTASANRSLLLAENLDTTALAGCLVNGCGNREGVSFRITSADYSTVYQEITTDDTPIENHGSGLSMYIRVANGTSCSNVVVEPMIRYADIIDATYEPYHASVEESKCDNTVIAPVENGSTASQAYAVGSHAIRNGAFITWKNAKAQGETINDASDYTSGMVGDAIYIEKNHGAQTITAGNFFSEAVTLPSGYDVVMSDIVLARAGVALYAVPKIVCTSNDKNSRTIVVLNSDSNDHTWDIYSHFILKKRN